MLYQMLSENSKVEVALMQAWSTAQEQSVKVCIKLLSICQDTSTNFPNLLIISQFCWCCDIYSANQKSVKPSKIAIFQVQMQSKNWCNNQIRSKNIFGHWFFAILSLFWGSFNLGVYDSWQNLSKKQWKNVQPTGGTKAVEGPGTI